MDRTDTAGAERFSTLDEICLNGIRSEAKRLWCEILTEKYFKLVIWKIRAMSSSSGLNGSIDFDDLAQEVFGKILRTTSRPKAESMVKTWILVLTKSMVKDHWQKRNDTRPFDPNETEPCAPETALRDVFENDSLNRCIGQLDADDAQIIRAYYFEFRTFEEIGKQIGKSVSTVSRYHDRAKDNLGKCMKRGLDR